LLSPETGPPWPMAVNPSFIAEQPARLLLLRRHLADVSLRQDDAALVAGRA